ncbi:hypothetical protein GPJ56_007961 [Histomonas meleagridis]|nr:hypothetical protein GPJ56_007961 [Histomonas meleagridis]
MVLQYRWRELDLVSLTSFTNVVTFIQFAILPYDICKKYDRINPSGSNEPDGFDKAVDVLLSQLDLIERFNQIVAPMRVLLFAIIILCFMNFLYVLFFMPSWRIILFFADLFIPCLLTIGCCFINHDYEEGRTAAIVFIVISLIYVLVRLCIWGYAIVLRKNFHWHIKAAHQITSVFLARITKEVDPQQLNEKTQHIHKKILSFEIGLNPKLMKRKTIFGFDLPFSMIIDAIIVGVLFLVVIIVGYGVGWESILSSTYEGKQLQDIVYICDVISCIILVGICIRIVLEVLWFIPKCYFILVVLRKLGFKGINMLFTVALLPILKMVLNAATTEDTYCGEHQAYDFNGSIESVVDYFSHRTAGCRHCNESTYVVNEYNFTSDSARVGLYGNCSFYCFRTEASVKYKVHQENPCLSENDITSIYSLPVSLLEVYFLAVLLQILRYMFENFLEIVDALPAPTSFVECKFSTIVNLLQNGAISHFTSYKHRSALFYFTFQQIKLFALFFVSLIPLFEGISDDEKESTYSPGDSNGGPTVTQKIVPWLLFATSIGISISQFFQTPYVSQLHNITNFICYTISSIFALLVAFDITLPNFDLPDEALQALFIIMFIIPFVIIFVLPFFLRKSKKLLPCDYSLPHVIKRDNFLISAYQARMAGGKLSESEYSDYSEMFEYDTDEGDRPHDLQQGNFNLKKFAPIHLQLGMEKSNDIEKPASQLWKVMDVIENEIDDAAKEMLESGDILLDIYSMRFLYKLLNFSIIFCSLLFGWALGNGIVHWKRSLPLGNDFYMNCWYNVNLTQVPITPIDQS